MGAADDPVEDRPDVAPLAAGEDDPDHQAADPGHDPAAADAAAAGAKYGARHIVLVIIPVTFCMTLVCFSIINLPAYKPSDDSSKQTTLYYTPIHETKGDGWGNLGVAVLNSLIFVSIVLGMTIVLVALYKYRCYKVIHVWLILSSFLLLFMFSFLYMLNFGIWLNVAMDYFSTLLVLLNFGVMGMLAIHWKAPLILQQMYLIIVGALMALILIQYIPPWTSWVLLAVLALYDLAAVLLPVGPLKVLVQIAQERDEPIFPALIYSSAMVFAATADGGDAADIPPHIDSPNIRSRRTASTLAAEQNDADGVEVMSNRSRLADTTDSDIEEEDRGVKLGLGDFIFYSILIGKAAISYDYTVIFSVYIAIIFGLIATVVLLAFLQRALPALPISIFFGLTFYFTTMYIVSPYVQRLSANQVFI